MKSLTRMFAFFRKEIFEIIRQPRLLVSLVLGPFIILLLFGVGYRTQQQPFRTLFVAKAGSEIEKRILDYAPQFQNAFSFMGVTEDQTSAMERLRRNEVDLVVAAPADIYADVSQNRASFFTLYHNEIDPMRSGYVGFVGQLYIDEINRTILRAAAAEGQDNAADLQTVVQQAQTAAANTKTALDAGDVARARTEASAVNSALNRTETSMDATTRYLDNISAQLDSAKASGSKNAGEVKSLLADLRADTQTVSQAKDGQSDLGAERAAADRIQQRLASLQNKLTEFRALSPDVLVRPLQVKAESIAAVKPDITSFFAPAVIVLLLQHLMVTFAALTLVREQQFGSIELFRAAPLTAFETLVGKYLSYMFFGGVLSAILTALMIFVLRVPMIGSWLEYALAIAALLFTSLGIGFLISVTSQTDSQAVQLSMLALLASVFFAGAFLSLQSLIEPMRFVSWSLPATYAIQLLQTIMLRGFAAQPLLLGGLFGIGLLLFFVSLMLLSRKMRTE